MYIHNTYCISPQQISLQPGIEMNHEPADNKMLAIEPAYEGIPPGVLRRMGKAIRMGVGAALPLIKQNENINGIIIGSANAGMDECVKFLNQIVQYEEGQLTPGNFVQSTSNVIAGQLGMITKNKGYNITHIHGGLAFENAMIDAVMQLNANPENSYLLGGVDEISAYHFNIEKLAGAYKTENITGNGLYETDSPGCIVGEGAAMFVVNAEPVHAAASITAINTLHSTDADLVKQQLKIFLEKNVEPGTSIDLFLSGENGDNRTLPFYLACETVLTADTTIARYKHLTGDYDTAAAMGLWYACRILELQQIPEHMLKRESSEKGYKNILMYNNFKGLQHSFVLVKGC
ncbi:MAG: beta-ketoacyl synthase chain length factor [Chitinophagaceae bacterium]|nr:beta-ketoacyl synthase chain length factor [Chitinophagaceae bacterium]